MATTLQPVRRPRRGGACAARAGGLSLLLLAAGADCGATADAPDPGPVTLRRLSRTEYDRTVHDVLGTDQKPSATFPPDDTGHGFDNLGDVLSLSPLHLELYQRAAESLAAEVTRRDGPPLRRSYAAADLTHSDVIVQRGSDLVILTNTTILVPVVMPVDGVYRVRVVAYGDQVGTEPARMGIGMDTRPATAVDVPATAAAPGTYEVTAEVFAGPHVVQVGFQNDYYDAGSGADRNLAVRSVTVEGPVDQDRPNPLRGRLYPCSPGDDDAADVARACADRILRHTGRLLYRRPLSPDEVTAALALYDQGRDADENGDFDAGIRLALEAQLLSPHFLFRVELDEDPASATPHPVSAHELATRMSYLLWSSAPDSELLDRADRGELLSDDVRRAQVARMLADPRAAALVDNFAAQWLTLRAIATAEPDATQFPTFSSTLRGALAEETRRFVSDFFPVPGSAERPLSQLLTSTDSYGNDAVAGHYGLAAPTATGWGRLALAGTTRRGILTQASLLTAESYPTRTSPVRRGKWVLEQLLCSPPPPPPPNVIGNFGQPGQGGTLRQRLEAHREKPVCASCHALMDPIGLGLEGFDAIGRARTLDEGLPIDTSGRLPSGQTFRDAVELAQILADDPRLARCAAEKLFTFALGRTPADGTVATDAARLDGLTAALNADGGRLRALITAIVDSDAFRYRRGGQTMDAAAPHPSQAGGKP